MHQHQHLLKLLTKGKSKGLTLIETIVATLVVGTLVSSVLPILLLATVIRVQARRIDRATQFARGYLEWIAARPAEIQVLQGYTQIVVPNSEVCPSGGIAYSFDCVLPPGNGGIPTTDLVKIPGVLLDGNNDGFSTDDPEDFVLQPMVNPNVARGVEVGVRVYRANAFTGGSTLTGASMGLLRSDNECSGSGLGAPINCPMVVMRADIVR
ncbi:MAG: hypothetical protein ACK4QL_08930 [Pseudanabaenaceae cyanobacterium]